VTTSPFALSSVYPHVRTRLEWWCGYRALGEVLRACPDVQIFIAGGVVRNCCLETALPLRDYDFFLGGDSIEQALAIFRKYGAMTRTPFGSPRWHPDERPEEYADLISIAEFRPGLWKCEDILDVLNQFDYTASALAFDLRTGVSFDPQNGLRDLLRTTMRMVRFDFPEGPFVPGAVLTRNAILWFRVLHYARTLGFTIEPLTLSWLKQHRDYVCDLAEFEEIFFPPAEGYLTPLT
jgi:tRNA nucleotidyltransferase (CCA-adding enzyme)